MKNVVVFLAIAIGTMIGMVLVGKQGAKLNADIAREMGPRQVDPQSESVRNGAAKLVVNNALFINGIVISNHGPVVKLSDVLINDRRECTKPGPRDEALQDFREATKRRMESMKSNPDPFQDKNEELVRQAMERAMQQGVSYDEIGAILAQSAQEAGAQGLMAQAAQQIIMQSTQNGIDTGTNYWRKDTVLQLGETVTVKNNCQGQILRIAIDTDIGIYRFGDYGEK